MKKTILFIIFTVSIILSSQRIDFLLSNSDYITGEDGVIRMYINIVGHVKNPGTYLVYDGVDLLTAISVAGGYMEGSNLDKIMVYKSNGKLELVNLNQLFDEGEPTKDWLTLNPHDTIYIDQKNISKILSTSNLIYSVLGLLNLAVTLEKN